MTLLATDYDQYFNILIIQTNHIIYNIINIDYSNLALMKLN